MTFDWYLLTNLDEFIETELPSRTLKVLFPDGVKDILLTSGNFVSVLIDGVFLPVGLNGSNPFSFEGYAVFYDADGLLWIGIENED